MAVGADRALAALSASGVRLAIVCGGLDDDVGDGEEADHVISHWDELTCCWDLDGAASSDPNGDRC